ncbi:MAG: hypothetical protein HY319_23395 [Armatimonadetes bacterium]|nr:hypothetical protein [Armatimonadota bacterium]
MDDRLRDFLEQARERGRIDSSGSFSLDLTGAYRKLARFQLPDPDGYLLKLLQAGVASGCREAWITLGANRLECRFPMARRTPDPDTLLEHLRASDAGGDEVLDSLRLGILNSLYREPCNLVYTVWQGKEGQALLLDPQQERAVRTPRPGTTVSELGWSFEMMPGRAGMDFWEKLRLNLGLRTGAHRLLSEQGRLCPVPLFLDHFSVRQPGVPFQRGYVRSLTEVYEHVILNLRQFTGNPPHSPENGHLADNRAGAFSPSLNRIASLRDPEEIGLIRSPLLSRWLTPEGDPVAPQPVVRASVAVTSRLEAPGRLHFVRSGVLLQPKEADLGCGGAVALLPSENLDLDLTTLGVVENEAYSRAVGWVRRQVSEMVGELRRMLPELNEVKLVRDYVAARLPPQE